MATLQAASLLFQEAWALLPFATALPSATTDLPNVPSARMSAADIYSESEATY